MGFDGVGRIASGGIRAREYRKGRFRTPEAVVFAVRLAVQEESTSEPVI